MKICFLGIHKWIYKKMISQGDQMLCNVRTCENCTKRQIKLQGKWHTFENEGAPIVIFPSAWGPRGGLN